MKKYVLILPLVILSVFLGYFGSSLKMEHVYAIATVTTVIVAMSGYLLFLKQQKAGDSKRTRRTKVATAFIAVLLFSTLIGVQLVNLVGANPIVYGGEKPPDDNTKPPILSIASPENYTIHNTNKVVLIFNVSLGESTTAFSSWIHEIYFKGDWQENKTYIDLEELYEQTHTNDRSSSLPPEFSFNLTNIPEGKHSITVYAKDTAGNIGTSETVYFSIDQTPKLLILGSNLPREYGYALVAATVIVAAIVGYLFLKILRRRPKQNATVNK